MSAYKVVSLPMVVVALAAVRSSQNPVNLDGFLT